MRWEDIYALARQYCAGEVTAEEYFDAVDEYTKQAIEDEVADMSRRRDTR